jgi:hypothetical protein
MRFDAAFRQAQKDLEGQSPYVIASKSGAEYADGKFRIAFFNRTFLLTYPDLKFEELGGAGPPPTWLQLMVFHYLITAKGIPVADEWVAYRQLPGASLFERKLQSAIVPLARAFDNNLELFRKAGLALGGTPMSRTGDAAFRFLALPRLPMACIFHLGEEELPSSFNILYDGAACFYLPTEDLQLLGIYLSQALIRAAEKAGKGS